MRVDSPGNMGQVYGTCCRQSRVRGLVGGLVACVLLIGFVFLLQYRGVPWYGWGVSAVLVALLVPWFVADAMAKFHSANWLVRLGPDGVWINLRSYQNRDLPEAVTVVYLPYKEIHSARQHIDTWTTPASPPARTLTHWKRESLCLSLASNATREIAKLLADERNRRAPVKGTHQPVTVPAAGVVDIAWRGHGNDVTPPLTRVLGELSQRVNVTDPTRTDRGSFWDLSDADLDELITHLVRTGDNLEAVQLLIRRRGFSSTEAHNFIVERAKTS